MKLLKEQNTEIDLEMNLEKKISVFNIKRFAVHDGPGIRTTVFFKGCSLHCPWCQNPEGISKLKNLVYNKNKCIQCHQCIRICNEPAISRNRDNYISINRKKCNLCGDCTKICPTGALEFDSREWLIDDLVRELVKDKIFFDVSNGGITFSGGEPLLHIDFISELSSRLKECGVHVAVQTSLMVNETVLRKALKAIDLFIADIKLLDKSYSEETIGLNLDLYKKNMEYLFQWAPEIICRIPLIPGYTSTQTNLELVKHWINFLNEQYNRNIVVEPINFNPLIKTKYLQLDKKLPSVNNWKKYTEIEMQDFYLYLNYGKTNYNWD